jgi:hypothetical protein
MHAAGSANVERDLKRWIDLFFWWLPRKEQTPPEKAEESAPSVTEQSAGRGS